MKETILKYFIFFLMFRERSGSVVECLTRDWGAVSLSLTGVTVLCCEQDTLILA